MRESLLSAGNAPPADELKRGLADEILVSHLSRRGVIGSSRLCRIGAHDAARGGVMPKTTRWAVTN